MPGFRSGPAISLDISDDQYKNLIASVQEANEIRKLLYENEKKIELAQAELNSIREELDREDASS